jgi:hypothetical protein
MILIEGGNKKLKRLAEEAALFAWKELFPRINNCYIEIHLKKMDGYQGTCEQIDDREYELQIDKTQDYEDFVTCIFHEMVHVKQYIRKELYSEFVFWKTREEYLNLPWEIEAYEKQEVLLEKWNIHSEYHLKNQGLNKKKVGIITKILSSNKCVELC